jgi:hypothetical protein
MRVKKPRILTVGDDENVRGVLTETLEYKVDLTEVRFRIVVSMLEIDKNLAKRLKAYLETSLIK